MSFGSALARGTRIAGAAGGKVLATDEAKRLVELDSVPIAQLSSISSGRVLGRASAGTGGVESLSEIPVSALPSVAARLDQAGSFAGLMTLAAGFLAAPLGSEPALPVEGQIWWRSGALWMRDATGVVPFIQSGTWTPTIRPDTVGDFAVAYAQQVGTWVRIGRTVILGFNLQTSSMTWTTAAGSVRILGLPFTPQSGFETLGTFIPRFVSGLSLPTTASAVYMSPSQGASSLLFYRQVPGSNTVFSGLSVGSGQGFVSGQNVQIAGGGLTYRIA